MNSLSSLWSATAPIGPELHPFEPGSSADAIVIGGGITGLSAALHIAGQGAQSVSVLEAEAPYVDGPPWQALFWRFERFGRLRSYVRPRWVRNICPRALMKSDNRDPYQGGELFAHGTSRVVPGLRWRPCRSSRLVALAKLEPLNLPCERSLLRRARFLTPLQTSQCGSTRRSSSSPRESGLACWPARP
jgi:hypothetical protein